MDYVRKSNMAEIQYGRQNGAQNTTILDFRHIGLSDVIHFGSIRFRPQKPIKSLNISLKSQIYIFHAILAAILDFRHIEFSDVIYFGKFGFLDPQNLEKYILQAKIH